MPHSPEGGRESFAEHERFTVELTRDEVDLIISAMVREREENQIAINLNTASAQQGTLSPEGEGLESFVARMEKESARADAIKDKLMGLPR